jgi:hypothetical protein
MRRVVLVVVSSIVAGCGDDGARPPQPQRAALGGDLIDPGAGAGDVVVATVNDRPVWASCVEGQARARAITVERALQDCIDIELLTAAAVARGIGADPDVQRELRVNLVDGFVGREFEDKIRTVADLPRRLVDDSIERNARELDRPELRTAVYVRAKLEKTATPEQDAAARAIAAAIHAELESDPGVLPEQLRETARRLGGAHAMDVDTPPWRTPRHDASDEAFAAALFAIPDIGRISPPTRTPWGWDVILLVDVLPAATTTRDALAAHMFPTLRHFYFDEVWTAQMQKNHRVESFHDRLRDDDDEAGSAAP